MVRLQIVNKELEFMKKTQQDVEKLRRREQMLDNIMKGDLGEYCIPNE